MKSTNYESPCKLDYRYLRYISLFETAINNFEREVKSGI